MRITCPHCKTVLNTPEPVPKQGRCPKCRRAFPLPESPAELRPELRPPDGLDGPDWHAPAREPAPAVPAAAEPPGHTEATLLAPLEPEGADEPLGGVEQTEVQPPAVPGPPPLPRPHLHGGPAPGKLPTAIPVSGRPAGQPAPLASAAQGAAGAASEVGQWCVVADYISPDDVVDALSRGKGAGLSARLECEPGRVRLCLRYLTRGEISAILVRYPFWLAWNFFVMLGCMFQPLLAFAAYLVSFGTDVALLVELPFIVAGCIAKFFATGLLCLWLVVEFVKGTIALVSGEPYTFVPLGLELRDEALAEFSPGGVAQVLRLDLSWGCVKKARGGRRGCLAALFTLAALPFLVVMQLIERFNRVALLAIVIGEPIDLTKPRGLLSRLFRRRKKGDKKERSVFLMTLDPRHAPDVQRQVEQSLGLRATVIDDRTAKETIWR